MKKKKRIFIILMLVFMVIILSCCKVFATDESCVLIITPDKTQAIAGDRIILVLTASNITAENGIAIYNGLIDYNSDIFELSLQDSSNGKWKGDLIENSITFTKSDLESTKDNQEIGRIILKIKSGANIGKQTIILKNNEFADSTSFKISDISTNVEVITENSNNNNNVIYDNNKNENNQKKNFIVDQEERKTATYNATVNTSTQANKFPYAGIILNRIIPVILIVAFIVGIYSFNKYRKIKY